MRPMGKRGPQGRARLALLAVALLDLSAACQSVSALECPGGAATCADASEAGGASDATVGEAGDASVDAKLDATASDAPALDGPSEGAAADAGSDGPDSDAAAEADADAMAPPEAGPDTSGIACMDGGPPSGVPSAYCAPPGQECCYQSGSTPPSLACQPTGPGCPTDIDCDKPAQCAGGACWMCLNDGGDLLATSCVLDQLGCPAGTAGEQVVNLCATGADCDAGRSCAPQTVAGFAAGWFRSCQ
jgi:hypothetical protein